MRRASGWRGNYRKNIEKILFKNHRHFTLTPTTLTYSKNANTPPLQIISLTKPSPLALTQHNGLLTLKRNMKPILVLTSNEAGNLNNWKETISKQISQILTNDTWIATSGRYVTMPVDCIQEPDCVGFLWKLGRRVKSWGRKYCVLKDGVMYFYGGEGEVRIFFFDFFKIIF